MSGATTRYPRSRKCVSCGNQSVLLWPKLWRNTIGAPAPHIRMTPALAWAMVKAMRHLWFQFVVATPRLGPRLLSRGAQRLPTWILRFFEVQPIPDDDVAAYLAEHTGALA